MTHRPIIRYILLVIAGLFLFVLAWWTISGGLQQFHRAQTFGQQLETVIQILCGLLSLLVILTYFWQQKWARSIRFAWAISLTIMAGLSSLVWGPPMPLVSLAFAGVALLLAWGVIVAMRKVPEY